MLIDVVMACGPKAEEYTEFVIDNVLSTATEHEFRFIIAEHKCNLQSLKTHPNVKQVISMPDDLSGPFSGANAHGRSVNTCMKSVTTDLVLTMDYDITFLTKGWDVWFVNQFLDPDVGIVGTEYSDRARGFPKYLNYPSIIMNMMRTKYVSEFNIDFRPKYEPLVITSELSHIFGRKIGSTVYQDTGVEIALKMRRAGIKGVTLKYVEHGVISLGQQFSEGNVITNHMKSGSMQTQDTIDTWKSLITKFVNEGNV